MLNSSGQGPQATVPAEIDKWNWGAFCLNWIWGLGNNTFIALLMFIPLVNCVMPFILGVKGSAWAWRNKQWASVEEFQCVQRKWAKWSVILLVAFVPAMAALFFGISAGMKSSNVYKLAAAKVEGSAAASELIGRPISTGMPFGSIEISGPRGKADISFGVEGPKGKGTVYVDAERDLGNWKINRIVLDQDGTGRRVDLNQ